MEKQINYLKKITDDFGIVQFSNKDNPDIKSGYTIDDVSRALIVSSALKLGDLSEIYFNFIKNAQTKNGKFINVYSEDKKALERFGSQDSFGRTLWALGEYFQRTHRGEEIIKKSLEALENFPVNHPASEAFTLLGLTKINDSRFEKEKTSKLIKKLADSLTKRVDEHSNKNWVWTSDEMTYSNARIPQALLRVFNSTGDLNYLSYGLDLKKFLQKTVFEKDSNEKLFLNVVGNNTCGLGGTWYKKDSTKPKFDEQPVDAGGMVELHSEFYEFNDLKENLEKAKISLDWFNGKNRLNKKMITGEGGIHDGLNESKVNPNQGAESLLAYMMAKIKFDEINKK